MWHARVAHYRDALMFRIERSTALAGLILGAALLGLNGPAAAAEPPTLRIFLRDGTTLASYGEYARVNGRVVFSLPLGQVNGEPRLQLVTIDAGQVDWSRTDRYREAVRRAQYIATRCEGDFELMTGEVAHVLNEIALTPESGRRLALAEEALKRLTAWPREHYGYRAEEVREIASLVEEAVSELRAAAGENSFDLNLVANVESGPAEPLGPPPTETEIIAQALSLAEVADVPAERIDLLRNTLDYIDRSSGAAPAASLAAAREFTARRLANEMRAEQTYATLVHDLTARAKLQAERADVRGLERLIQSVPARDASLGAKRPDQVRSLIATLQDQLDAARRLRLARDQWRLRGAAYRAYTRLVRMPLADLEAMRSGLEDIKRLAGPDAPRLSSIGELASRASRMLHGVIPPAELASVHSLLQSACDMGGNAARTRMEAVRSGAMTTAWNASAAASGALMMLSQAHDELTEFLAPPKLR